MSTFVLVMATGMMLGDGPGRVSGEMELGIDRHGEWKAVWQDVHGQQAELLPDLLLARTVEEGAGKARVKCGDGCRLGIWEQNGDRLVICLRKPGLGRPTSFRIQEGQDLLIFHRVNPRK